MRKIRKNDKVVILAGKDKGRNGKVLRVIQGKRVQKVLVEGVNMIKKHVKPNPQANQEGGIIEREAPLQISNVAIYNAAADKADRVGFKFLEDGRKVRFFKSTGEVIDA